MRLTPRTCPSTRARRPSRSSFEAVYPRVAAMAASLPDTPRGYLIGSNHECGLERAEGQLPDGVGGLVGAGARLRHLGGGAGVGPARADRVGAVRLGAAPGGARRRARSRVVVLLL